MSELPIHPELGNMVEIDNYDARLRERNLAIKAKWEAEGPPGPFPPVGIRGSGTEMRLLAEYLRLFWPKMQAKGIGEEDFGTYWRWVDGLLNDPINPHEALLAFCLRFFERWDQLSRERPAGVSLRLLKQVTLQEWLEKGKNVS